MAVEWKEVENPKGDFWTPQEKGEELIGVLVDSREGQYGKQYLIEAKDKTMMWTPSHKVLQNRMQGVEVGRQVKIVYDGEEPPKVRGENPTKMYKVFTGN